MALSMMACMTVSGKLQLASWECCQFRSRAAHHRHLLRVYGICLEGDIMKSARKSPLVIRAREVGPCQVNGGVT